MHSTQAGKDEDLEHQNRHNSADRPLDIAAQATSSALFRYDASASSSQSNC
jgi:hypothetical protein